MSRFNSFIIAVRCIGIVAAARFLDFLASVAVPSGAVHLPPQPAKVERQYFCQRCNSYETTPCKCGERVPRPPLASDHWPA